MKKVLFLMFLLFLGLEATNVNAQVRIGGNTAPQGAAVLDLNVDNSATPTTNKGALALPRVSLGALSGALANLNGTTPINGMLVYNTNTTAPLAAGIYVWSGTVWTPVTTGSSSALTDTLSGGGLTRTGSLVGIKVEGVVGSMIANSTVSLNKLSTTLADSGMLLASNGSSVVFTTLAQSLDTTTRTYALRSVRPTVSFTLIVDTTINRKNRVGYYQRISIPGLLQTDLCFTTDGIMNPAAEYAGYLDVADIWRRSLNQNMRLRCYRPSV